MTPLAAVLIVLLLATAGYLVLVLRQIHGVRRQLERHVQGESRAAVTLALVAPQLEALVARVNDTVREAQAASARTRVEERRIRSFIADISHDLRTPLTTVRGYLQLLERTELSDDQQAYLAVARRQTRELGALVDRLYEYAYLLDGEPGPRIEPVDVGVLVAECLLGMTAEIEAAGVDVRYEPPSGVVIGTDREKVTRIVQNLLRNAVQHGRERLAVEVTPAADEVEIGVANGVAGDVELDTSRLFDRFFTADGSRSGRTSGLGLSIVQALARQLGGGATAEQDRETQTVQIRVRVPHASPAA